MSAEPVESAAKATVPAAPAPRWRVVALGDSVTDGARPGVSEAQTFRHLLHDKLGALGLDVEVFNAGKGSDTTDRGLARLASDVLAQRPDLVLVMFGLNDAAMVDGGPSARTEPRVPLAAYRANLRAMVGQIRAAGAAVLLCTPTPMSRKYLYQDVGAYATNADINYQLRRYVDAVRDLARELDLPLVDGFRLFTEPPEALDLIEDGCHPFVQGHARLAAALVEPVRRLLAGVAPTP